MAWELGQEKIRINIVATDTTASEGNYYALPPHIRDEINADIPEHWWEQNFAMYIPLQTPPSGEDIANTVLFLASDLSKSITGQVMHVDGGTAASLGMLRWPYDEGVTLPLPMGNTMRKLYGNDK